LNPCGQARFSAAEEQSILITRLAVVSTEEEQQQKEQQQKQDQWLADQQAPAHRKGAFIWPNCGAYAHQEWFEILIGGGWGHMDIGSQVSKCAHCGKFAYWVDEKLVYPAKRQGPPPHPEMPDEPRADYNEARGIVGPRASRRRARGRRPCPVAPVLQATAHRQTSPLLPPKGMDPRTLRLFPCKPDVFRGPPEGAMIAFLDPQASRRRAGGRRRCPRL